MADPGDKGGLVIMGIILAMVGLGFFVGSAKDGYERWQEKTRFMAVAKQANATVVDHKAAARTTRSAGGGLYYVPVIRFTDAAGREWTGTMNRTSTSEYRRREKLIVLYEPADPRNVWEGPPSMKHVILGIVVSGMVMTLGCGLVFFFGRNRPADG